MGPTVSMYFMSIQEENKVLMPRLQKGLSNLPRRLCPEVVQRAARPRAHMWTLDLTVTQCLSLVAPETLCSPGCIFSLQYEGYKATCITGLHAWEKWPECYGSGKKKIVFPKYYQHHKSKTLACSLELCPFCCHSMTWLLIYQQLMQIGPSICWSSNTLATCYEELIHWKWPWCWERLEEKGVTDDEMVGWHHWLKGQEFEQTPGDTGGQRSLARRSP